jgi:hypothetical protein
VSSYEIAVSSLEQIQKRTENALARIAHEQSPIRHPVRRQDHAGVMKPAFTRES